MTIEEARRKAKTRWGKHAYARITRQGMRHMVGIMGDPGILLGCGDDWNEAFADATTTQARHKLRLWRAEITAREASNDPR